MTWYAFISYFWIVLMMSQVKRLEKQRLKAIAVNREALNAASKLARNLWKEVKEGGYQVVFLSPEMLPSTLTPKDPRYY